MIVNVPKILRDKLGEEETNALVLLINQTGIGLATKNDLLETKSELKQEIAEIKSELKQEIAEIKSELKQEIARTREDFLKVIANTRNWVVGLWIGQVLFFLGIYFGFLR